MADSRASNAIVSVVSYYAAELAAVQAERDALAEQLRRQAGDARGVAELVEVLTEKLPGWAAGCESPCQVAARLIRNIPTRAKRG